MMELYNQPMEEVLQHFVNNVSIEQYRTTKDKHVKFPDVFNAGNYKIRPSGKNLPATLQSGGRI
jgi:hypothetical protein